MKMEIGITLQQFDPKMKNTCNIINNSVRIVNLEIYEKTKSNGTQNQ